MDFDDTAEEAVYRSEVKAWIAVNRPGNLGPDAHAVSALAGHRDWQRRKADAGYACITWPKDWGGRGGAAWQAVIFAQEEAAGDTPFSIGLGRCVPTIMTAGNSDDRIRFGPPAIRGDEIWCQLFSEPSGGSDLAAAQTRATRDGDDWIIRGQKVWTSGAHYSDFGLLLARTDPDVPKHHGLTMFWVDMRTRGIEVKPIQQMSGVSNFNEVFFDDVRIGDNQRVGEVGDGWRTSLVTLMNERLAVGAGGVGAGHQEVIKLARGLQGLSGRALDDGALRDKIADWYVRAEGLKFTRYRTLTALTRGQTPGPEASIGKIVWASLLQDIADTAIDLQDQYGIISDPALAPLAGTFQGALMRSPGGRIAGGTDEILRNIIAERVLGLPADIRVDKTVAFKDLPSNR